MSSSADATDDAKPFLVALVRDSEARIGSRMRAYAETARSIGLSASWVEKVFSNREGLTLKVPVYRRIALAYIALCERIEAQEQRERARREALLEKANAAVASTMGMVPRVPAPKARGTR